MSWRRRKLLLICIILVGGVILFAVWPREPVYQGRALSDWSQELENSAQKLAEFGEIEGNREAWVRRQKMAETAIRNIGPGAVSWLTKWVFASARPKPFRDKLEDLLEKQKLYHIELPERKDRFSQAVLAFEVLGRDANRALPELGKLLENPRYCEYAIACLHAIGPAALSAVAPALTNSQQIVQKAAVFYVADLGPQIGVPAVSILANAVTNASCAVQSDAFLGLGDLGPLATGYAPWVESIMRNTNHSMGPLATRVITELSLTSESYASFFRERLCDTNYTSHAAFALAQIGDRGVKPLLQGLTNKTLAVRSAAFVALGAKMNGIGIAARPPLLRFSWRSLKFDTQLRSRESTARNAKVEQYSIATRLAGNLDHPDVEVRLDIVQLLSGLGQFGGLGLSKACQDSDEAVRTAARRACAELDFEVKDGAITRGPRQKRQIALMFTGHEYAEGGERILTELKRHGAAASFFFTGKFLANPAFTPLVEQIIRERHYIGPHSDKHLLYCGWENRKTLITRDEFNEDFSANLEKLQRLQAQPGSIPHYFVPPYEHCNVEIAEWAADFSYITVNLSPGTRSAADYTEEADTNFVSSESILASVIGRERQDADGLNGFILLFHIGSGPGRSDKFHSRFGELLDYLAGKGYKFVSIDELFDPQAAQARREKVLERFETSPETDAFRKRYGLQR